MLATHEYDLNRKVLDRAGGRWEVIGRIQADAGMTLLLLGQRYDPETADGESGYDPIQIVPEGQVRDTYTAAPDFTAAEAQADLQRFLAAAQASGIDLSSLIAQQQQPPQVQPGVPVVPSGPDADASVLPGGTAPPAPAPSGVDPSVAAAQAAGLTPDFAAPAPPAPAAAPPPAPSGEAPGGDAPGEQFVQVPGVGVIPLSQAIDQGLVSVVAQPTPQQQ